MEENQNVENVVTNEAASETTSELNEKKGLKNTKNLIIIAVVAIIAIVVLVSIFGNATGKAKGVVKQYVKAMNKLDIKKTITLTDPYGSYVLSYLDKDEYDEFWDEYKDFIKDKDDKYDDVKESYEESLEKDNIKDAKDSLEESMEDTTIRLKKISDVEKVGKNLYKVKARIEVKNDDNKKTETEKIYVMKKGMKCYIVGIDMKNIFSLVK